MDKSKAPKIRILIFAVISILSIFLLGGGKFSDMYGPDAEGVMDSTEQKLIESVLNIGDIPEDSLEDWKICAAKNPQLFLQVMTVELKYPAAQNLKK